MSDIKEEIKELEETIKELKNISSDRIIDASEEIKEATEKLDSLRKKAYANLTPWDKVEMARDPRKTYSIRLY